MHSPVDPRFAEEANTYRLRFACPDCAHFEPETRTCSNGYPSEPHLDTRVRPDSVIIFCKSFELF